MPGESDGVEFIVVYLEVGCNACLRMPEICMPEVSGQKLARDPSEPGLTGLTGRDYISRLLEIETLH